MAMSELVLDNVSKSYDGGTRAVDSVSLTIADGEFVTFLGPSGSGKTTTLMLIAGFEKPTAGSIRLGGRAIEPIPPHRRNIGLVFQNYALFPHMSVAANVAYPLRMRRYPKREIEERVARMLDIVGLSAFRDAEPRRLSGGQQQRVALARALVFEPTLLLLDEPLGALDKNLREQMQIEIRRIHRKLGVTTVYVTHDQTEAMTMSDRIAVFNGGRIEQVAAPLEIYRRPASRFVAGFVGDNNVLAGRVVDGTKGVVEIEGLGTVGLPNAPSLSAQEKIWLAIRPESVRRVKDGECGTRYPLRVTGLVNYGDSALLMGMIGSCPLKMRIAAMETLEIHEGAVVDVGWDPAQVHVIRERW
jgi:putative spermidine/putrescine transport system ATP-binding protein